MEYIIYGAGKYGQWLVSNFQERDGVRFQGFIDVNKRGRLDGLPIFTIDEARKEQKVIISIRKPEVVRTVNDNLRNWGFENIFWYDNISYAEKLEDALIDTSSWGENVLPYVEMHVSDCCNLNCKGCTHFSPLFNSLNANLENAMNDVKKLMRKVSHIMVFRLLGGEPFLNSELGNYVESLRSMLPDTCIQIVTNGLLIPKVKSEILECIRKNHVIVSISNYPPTKEKISEIMSCLDKHGVRYVISRYEDKAVFNKPLSIIPDIGYHYKCMSEGCVNIYNGKIARCPTLMYIFKFNHVFGTHLPEDGIVDLCDNLSGIQLLEKLNQPVPLCKHCIDNEIPWQKCGKVPLLEDFAIWK